MLEVQSKSVFHWSGYFSESPNYLTAAICQATNQQPAQVCGANPVPQIEQTLGKAGVGAGGPQLGFVEKPFEAVVRRPGRVARVVGVVGVAA